MRSPIVHALFTSLLFAVTSRAQGMSYTTPGADISETFNHLAISGTNKPLYNNPNGQGLPHWFAYGFAFNTWGQYTHYVASTGSSTTEGLHSFGSSGSTDRAFGALSDGVDLIHYGVKIWNHTGSTLTSVRLRYDGEQWRRGHSNPPAVDKLDFSWAIDGSGSLQTTFLYTGTFTDLDALDFVAPATGSAGARNGNDPLYRQSFDATIPLVWEPNHALWFRWTDRNIGGSIGDDGLAIDNLVMMGVPEPSPWALLGAAAVVGAVLHRTCRPSRRD